MAPDVLVKFAYDKDKVFHIEVGGLARFFRDEYNPLIYTTTGTTTTLTGLSATIDKNTKTGGGVYGSARFYAGQVLLRSPFKAWPATEPRVTAPVNSAT